MREPARQRSHFTKQVTSARCRIRRCYDLPVRRALHSCHQQSQLKLGAGVQHCQTAPRPALLVILVHPDAHPYALVAAWPIQVSGWLAQTKVCSFLRV